MNSQKKSEDDMQQYQKETFGYDLAFLKSKDSVVVLKNGDAQLIVSPKYQAKVFTSTAEGLEGNSFGWINYEAFDKVFDPHINAYGGENRFWLGPEGGKVSLFFKPGTEMVFDNWVTPPAIDIEPWDLISHDETSASLSKETSFINYAGSQLDILIKRDIKILDISEIKKSLNVDFLEDEVKVVGYSTHNKITNNGTNTWNKETGAPCIWILDMFKPSPYTVIIIPYKDGEGEVATTDYFGEIPEDRIAYQNNILYFKADGQSRGKLGISPQRAQPIAGSYDAINKVLTVTIFDIDPEGVYLNQEWTTDKDPYIGDAVNAYNDGPLENGSQLGPFYEIESVSPAAFLEPGKSLFHIHDVFHFIGDEVELDKLTRSLFDVSLDEIKGSLIK